MLWIYCITLPSKRSLRMIRWSVVTLLCFLFTFLWVADIYEHDTSFIFIAVRALFHIANQVSSLRYQADIFLEGTLELSFSSIQYPLMEGSLKPMVFSYLPIYATTLSRSLTSRALIQCCKVSRLILMVPWKEYKQWLPVLVAFHIVTFFMV